MKYITIIADKSKQFVPEKGNRIIVQVQDEYFAGIVTDVKSGQIYLQFDDGDTGKVSIGSKRILGFTGTKQIKKAMTKSEAEKKLITINNKASDSKQNDDDYLKTFKKVINYIKSHFSIIKEEVSEYKTWKEYFFELNPRDTKKVKQYLKKMFTCTKERKNERKYTIETDWEKDNVTVILTEHNTLTGGLSLDIQVDKFE